MKAQEKVIYKTVHDAVKHGDVLEMEMMVRQGASINEVDDHDKFTPLHWACHVGALECLHWLVWHGADHTVVTPRGWSPIHIAAIRGQDACMQALVKNGANLNMKDARGNTAAMLAAAHGNSFTLNTIMRAGQDIHSTDKNGWTPIHFAAYHGRLGCLQTITRWGGSYNETDNVGNTPGHLAAMEGHLPCFKFLVSISPSATHCISARNDQGETPKILAQQFYKQELVDYINNIEFERDNPEEEESLAFPGHKAAYEGRVDVLRRLIENGVVNINERDDRGATPAHKAAGQGHIEVLQWLIEMGANLTITNNAGETAKDIARRFSQLAAIKVLGGDNDSDIEEEDEDGEKISRPAFANTEGEGIEFTKSQKKQAQGRAKKKIEDLERLLEMARANYVQLGGQLKEDKRRLLKERENERLLAELEAQLDYERIRREKLEAQVDEYRRDIAHLNSKIEELTAHDDLDGELLPPARGRRRKNVKHPSAPPRRPRNDEDGYFIRRNVVLKRRPQSADSKSRLTRPL